MMTSSVGTFVACRQHTCENDCLHTCRNAFVSVHGESILSMQGCKSGPGDASHKLDNDNVDSTEPRKAATPQKQDNIKSPRPALLHASESTVRDDARYIDAAASGGSQANVETADGQDTDSHENSPLLSTG